MHMSVNTAVRAVFRSPGTAARLGVLCLRVGAFTIYIDNLLKHTANCGELKHTADSVEQTQVPPRRILMAFAERMGADKCGDLVRIEAPPFLVHT